MIDLRKLERFVAVAEELHFHRAAERLAMSQPPLTVAIRRLEEALGVTLIERGNRVLGLTPAGQRFPIEARETLGQMERAIASARDTAAGRTGTVRLGYVGSALYGRLPDAIHAFRASRPGVRLELREATSAAQVAGLRDGKLDIAAVIPPLVDAADVALSPFDRDRLCMALAQDHPKAAQKGLALSELAEESFVLWPRTEGRGFHLRVVRLCSEAGFTPNVVQEAHGMHAVLSLVAVGSIVPASMAVFRPDRVRYRSLQGDAADFEIHLAVRGLTPAGQAFLDAAVRVVPPESRCPSAP